MPQRPNIIVIMADDHAANAVSVYRSRLAETMPTPHIDRIGLEGAVFERAFCSNAICTPSRASFLTGQHSHTNGVRTLEDPLDTAAATFPRLLHESGYATALIGKWHLHSEPQGFDHYEVLPAHGSYRDPRFIDPSFDWSTFRLSNAEANGTQHQGHVTDLITEKCLRWLRSVDREKPFLLLCHHKAPHDDFEYQERFEHILDGVHVPEPDSLWEDRSHRSEGSRNFGSSVSERSPVRSAVHRMSQWDYPTGRLDVRGLDPAGRAKAAYQKYLRDYLRTVAGIDESVGAILDWVDQEGLAEDTVVVYTSDQGMFLGEHDYLDKRWIFEEALRLPLLLRYPKAVAAGRRIDSIVGNVDFAPTMLELAGLEAPPAMQGHSFGQLLSAGEDPAWADELYYRYWMHLSDHDNPAHFGIRTPGHKLIFFYGLPLDAAGAVPEDSPASWELYDLAADPAETSNVAGRAGYEHVALDLRERLLALRRGLGDEDTQFPEVEARMQSTWPW